MRWNTNIIWNGIIICVISILKSADRNNSRHFWQIVIVFCTGTSNFFREAKACHNILLDDQHKWPLKINEHKNYHKNRLISPLFKVVLEWLMKNDYIIRDALLSIIFIKNVPSWTGASERWICSKQANVWTRCRNTGIVGDRRLKNWVNCSHLMRKCSNSKSFYSLKVNKRKPQEPWKMYATGIPYLFHLDISDTIEDVA